MILDDIIHIKHMKFAEGSYLYDIVKILENQKASKVRRFWETLSVEGLTIIGEIKKASPVTGIVDSEFNIGDIAGELDKYADAVSVVTEEHYYNGKTEFMAEVRNITALPLLRRDFVISPIQIFQAKSMSASAVLLLEKIMSDGEFREYLRIVRGLNMDPVVEVQSIQGLERALKMGVRIISINCVRYEDFTQDEDMLLELGGKVPENALLICDCYNYSEKVMRDIAKIGVAGIFVSVGPQERESVAQKISGIREIYYNVSR